ncbi:hypothetical protein ACF061_07895 [Streptomyces sp. NPDC015220]|uniref:hypothetical protein n=1 Tax=Streptomyces sp. NPDC015220 TaxID=3364947 RepID=UPI0036FEF51A
MEQRVPGVLPQYAEDMPTRELCGWTYRSDRFADAVTRLLVTERFAAHARPQGIDLVAVIRHARRARRLYLLRDITLVLCLAALVASAVGCAAAVTASDGRRLVVCLEAALCALLAGGVLVYVWGWVLTRSAQAVHWGDGAPRDGAAPVDAALESDLDALQDANVVLYQSQGRGGEKPFVDSGVLVLQRTWPSIDISRPARNDDGDELTVTEVKPAALHAYMAEHLARTAGLDGLRACNRLYVQGDRARDLDHGRLFAKERRRPLVNVDTALVDEGITAEGTAMRTYLTLELVGTGGSYVVTMHVRARVSKSQLSWQLAAYYLPPVDGSYGGHPMGGGEVAWRLLGFTRAHLGAQLFGSAGRVLDRPARYVRDGVRLLWRSHRVRRPHGYFDYGASGTLRAAVSDPDRSHDQTQQLDAQLALQRMQEALLTLTERFLKEHGIDTSGLREARVTITMQTYNFRGPINGQNVFGDGGTNILTGTGSTPGTPDRAGPGTTSAPSEGAAGQAGA